MELLSQDCSVCVLHRTCLRTDDTATEDKLLGFNFQKLCLHYTITTSAKAYRWQELPLVSRLGKVNQLTSGELMRNKPRSEKSNSSLPLTFFQTNHTLKLLSYSQKKYFTTRWEEKVFLALHIWLKPTPNVPASEVDVSSVAFKLKITIRRKKWYIRGNYLI